MGAKRRFHVCRKQKKYCQSYFLHFCFFYSAIVFSFNINFYNYKGDTAVPSHLKSAVVPLVEPPRPKHRDPHQVVLLQNSPQRVDRSLLNNSKKYSLKIITVSQVTCRDCVVKTFLFVAPRVASNQQPHIHNVKFLLGNEANNSSAQLPILQYT